MSQDSLESAQLSQLSIYLTKVGTSFDDVINLDGGIARKPNFQLRTFDVDGGSCRFFYFESTTAKATPPWLEFVNERLDAGQALSFAGSSRNPNGILLISVDGRLFAAAFGRSAGACLTRKVLELDFGIRTAMNLCGNERVRQTRTQNNSITPTHIDRQVAMPSDPFVLGLSEAEDLRAISAHLKGEENVTLQGRDSLTIKALGDKKLTWPTLIGRLRSFLVAYDSRDFVDLFPNYRNFTPATNEETEKLDDMLIETLRSGALDGIQLWVPEILQDDEFSFAYSASEKRENNVYGYLDVAQLNAELKLESITLTRLQSKRIFAYSHADSRIREDKWWSVYDCLLIEQKLSADHFLLSAGRWQKVDPDFYRTVTDFVRTEVVEEACEDLYKGIDIADIAAGKNKEELFNVEACRRRAESVLFDRSKLQIGRGRKDKEFCDILDITSAGVVRIIHCKPLKGSSALNYLFAQAQLYCEAFLSDATFLSDIRAHIQSSGCPTMQAYLNVIAAEPRQVKGQDYCVCLWLLYDEKLKTVPTRTELPLIAQFGLKLMHDRLRNVCKFQKIVLRFVPVKMVNFKSTKPLKMAA
ncbi:DUF6119 family protein [Bosea sp. (in: a-proteobacteria)]|uniref:DUF6119 family protein n=1 Tax=Bosea sp. (in: a-proteobacteria) TaxID=1871050 RepID=UPI002DDD07AE|nr:DUF6119 family protein [Bosea sp. (in: a-proteobacteria)]HEV2512583.1 DUF6119 family protein [Bosea sp. (in: a-proteobacteria)]